jgi:ankyrin repeat protein
VIQEHLTKASRGAKFVTGTLCAVAIVVALSILAVGLRNNFERLRAFHVVEHAVLNGNQNDMTAVLDGLDWNTLRVEDRKLIVMLAVEHGRLEMLQELHRRGAPIDFMSKDGDRPLHLAVIGKRPDIVEFLLTKGVDANQTNGAGWTPLHLLPLSTSHQIQRRATDYKMAELLLRHGAVAYGNVKTWEFADDPFERVISSGDTNLMALYMRYISSTSFNRNTERELIELSESLNPSNVTLFLSNALSANRLY